jgi:hypothetical protein
VQLLVRALIAGLATLDVVGAVMPPRHFHGNVGWLLAATLFADLLLTAIMEWRASRSTPTAKAAARAMLWGRYAWSWWGAGTVVGYALPLGSIAVTGLNRPDATAAVAVLVGLYAREHAFVMAAQEVPNS